MLLIFVLLAGCTPDKPVSTVQKLPNAPALEAKVEAPGIRATDPLPGAPSRVRIDVFDVSVPYGSVSRNDAFWKQVDESAVDVGTHDLLLLNGVRVGIFPESSWPTIKQFIEDNPNQTSQHSTTGPEGRNIEMPMTQDIEYQDIFYFDNDGRLVGESFENCTNTMQMTYCPAPRKQNTVRISLCPAVVIKKKMMTESYVRHLYDLNLRVDVPADQALVIAPSSDARRAVSIGRIFLTTSGKAERLEHVLIIVARPVTLIPTGKTTK